MAPHGNRQFFTLSEEIYFPFGKHQHGETGPIHLEYRLLLGKAGDLRIVCYPCLLAILHHRLQFQRNALCRTYKQSNAPNWMLFAWMRESISHKVDNEPLSS